ncbi:MAG: DUF4301 family protein [Bacteroidales bacterium]|nr:DUF4301 family protein [Bacteroidales bacterium]
MLSESEIKRQKALLESEGNFVDIAAPATPDNGITIVENQQHYIDLYDEKSKNYVLEKFVPASGAATRMFKRLIAFNNEPNLKNLHDGGDYSVRTTIDSLPKFAFWGTLKDSISDVENLEEVSDKILHEPLNYAGLPKGLVEFHCYDGFSRTAFEEQIFEAVALNNSDAPAKLEFTVSEEHYEMFKSLLDKIMQKNKLNVDVKFSFQEKSTNTVAIYNDGTLVKTADGELFTRPGGHGSLLQNLNAIDADIIFIKNIDNIVHQDYMPETLPYKKLLGGVLIEVVENIKSYMQSLENDKSEENCNRIAASLEKTFCTSFERNHSLCDTLVNFMNRPIRVCGMVKNTGEPGGGPFLVRKDGKVSLQIVEKAQINLADEVQKQHFNGSTHFNPVDLVCYTKDVNGCKFDLNKFVDPSTCFVSEKTYNGKPIKVLEHPGLWNGSMADWLTIFVEVPLITFNPVKELNDLLRKEHQRKA